MNDRIGYVLGVDTTRAGNAEVKLKTKPAASEYDFPGLNSVQITTVPGCCGASFITFKGLTEVDQLKQEYEILLNGLELLSKPLVVGILTQSQHEGPLGVFLQDKLWKVHEPGCKGYYGPQGYYVYTFAFLSDAKEEDRSF